MTVTEIILISDRLFFYGVLGLAVYAAYRTPWKQFWAWLTSVEPVVVDGGLAVCIAMFLMAQTVFSSDDAYKYCNPWVLFWLKAFFGIIGSGFGALKAFRSIEYARHQKMLDSHGGALNRYKKRRKKP